MSKEERKHIPSFSEIFTKFADNTTAHGFAHIASTKKCFVKFFWSLLIIGCLAYLCYQIRILILQCLKRPIATKIWLENEDGQDFPIVAICNRNSIKKDKLPELLNTPAFKPKLQVFAKLRNTTHVTSLARHELFTHLNQATSLIATQNGSMVYQYSNSFNETILSCSYAQTYDCKKHVHWRQFWHWKYGSCFAFNTGVDQNGKKVKLFTSKAGKGYALSLTIGVNQSQYINQITNEVSAIMYVGAHGVKESLYNEGVSFQPGQIYYAVIQKKKRIRVDRFNNKSCIDHYKTKRSSLDAQPLLTKHSVDLCQEQCYVSNYQRLCNCTTTYNPATNNYPPCGHGESSCMGDVSAMLKNESISCLKKCRYACDSTHYSVVLTSAGYLVGSEKQRNRDDLLDVQVYFKSLEVEVTEDHVIYTLTNLLSDIGGQLGLWCGYSVLTIVEVLGLLLLTLLTSVKHCQRNCCNKNK
ncbi:acid-sensing ion channel 1C-like [Hydractinia symbiolongicarpus]|uniref:acid-sensing ion channel 1C-like n=1 Tax=Hydractinia symbiolongicarpus TaxID=13093 RepID=UPI00254FA702|nr:acid-sensing ion channel 1C-like [Hydractinia symbiolongicarpus]